MIKLNHSLFPLIGCLMLLASCAGRDYSVSGGGVTIKVCQADTSSPALIRIKPVGEKIIRISATPGDKFNDRTSLVVLPQKERVPFDVKQTDGLVNVTTSGLTVSVSLADGHLTFYDAEGKEVLSSGYGGGISFSPAEAEGKRAWSVHTVFDSPSGESFYGLGQQQSGEFDHKGLNEELYQYNTKISIPFVVSSRGYGLLFDAYSLSRWGNPQPYGQIGDAFTLYDKNGIPGALTGIYSTAGGQILEQREDSLFYENEFAIRNLPDLELKGATVTYEGFLEAPEAGDYYFSQYYAGFQTTCIGDDEVMSRRWRPAWNPNSYRYRVHFEKGERKPFKLIWEPDGDVSYMSVKVAHLQDNVQQSCLSFWSEFEPQLDCYFIAGDSYDDVISGYRTLTGKASLYPKWSFGFWQSRERYSTQEEVVGTLAELRRRHIPVDNIVQDWQYWPHDQWGSHEFEASRYPDPEKMLDEVHALHGRFMISVWPKFYTNTEHYRQLKEAGYVYPHAEEDSLRDWLGYLQCFYDAYSKPGRELFWQQIDESLYSRYNRKIDAWWMDASEPNLRDCLPMDYLKWLLSPTALGPSTEYLNAYSLVNADAIYNGQRSVDPDKRVFLLTRNGFAGLQRYSTASWSGDIGTSWNDMRMQMAAGLNYCMSGLPMWGMDIGGFSVMDKFSAAMGTYLSSGTVTEDLLEWRELQTRWHQWGCFVPLFRAHGQWPQRELWNIAPEGDESYESILWYMQLRYRLMPYIYSLAGAVHFNDYTIMRGLPMDFPCDSNVRNISDQWMFGPALMPCPVYEYKTRNRNVYLPDGGWYDFYSGEYLPGGGSVDADAPYGRMPLFVRAGSIIPFGPAMEWSDEKPSDDILLAVYAGRDASFSLYEDEGVNYNYEKGLFSTIPIVWDDASRTLTIGARQGSFPGMLQQRKFRIVAVDPDRPWRYEPDSEGVEVYYEGAAVSVNIR